MTNSNVVKVPREGIIAKANHMFMCRSQMFAYDVTRAKVRFYDDTS